MGTRALVAIIIALVVFIVVIELIDTLITGTDTGSELINNLAPLLTAVGVILVIVFAFITIGQVRKGGGM